MHPDDTPSSSPRGYCRCGCGQKAAIAKRNYYDRGIRKGEPMHYAPGHGVVGPRKARPLPILLPSISAALIPLVGTRGEGLFALVDIADLALVAVHRWSALITQGRVYAMTRPVGDRDKSLLMHRLIAGDPADMMVDHANGNGLDNRRRNLRVCTHTQNMRNKRTAPSRSGYRGVSWIPTSRKWRAHISLHHKTVVLGYFESAEDAAHVYDAAARKHYGEFARLNFPAHNERKA